MSKTSERRRLIRLGTVIAVVLCLVLGWELVTSVKQLVQLDEKRAETQAQLDAIEAHNEALEEDIELAQTDDYVIRMARKVLGWVFPDDIRIVEDNEP